MKKILITSLLCFVVIISKAQNESKDSSIDMGSKKNHYIGFNAGAATGLGLAYRYQNNKHSYQIALLPIMSERNAFVNIGGRYAFNFRQDEKTSFFGYIGHATTYVSRKDYNYINELEYTRTDLSLITGAGFGTEINLNKVLALNFALGIAHYFQSEPYNVVTLTGEIGLFYKLN